MSISGAKPGVKLAYQGVDLGAIVVKHKRGFSTQHIFYQYMVILWNDWKQMFKTIQHLET